MIVLWYAEFHVVLKSNLYTTPHHKFHFHVAGAHIFVCRGPGRGQHIITLLGIMEYRTLSYRDLDYGALQHFLVPVCSCIVI